MQLEDLQQSRIRSVTVAIGVARFRSSVPTDAYVHDPNELCEGLGCGIPTTDGHLDSLLDRIAFKRAAAVAGQGTHADGIATATLLLDVLKCLCILHPFVRERKRNACEYASYALLVGSSSLSSIGFLFSSWYVRVSSIVSSLLEHCTVKRAYE